MKSFTHRIERKNKTEKCLRKKKSDYLKLNFHEIQTMKIKSALHLQIFWNDGVREARNFLFNIILRL